MSERRTANEPPLMVNGVRKGRATSYTRTRRIGSVNARSDRVAKRRDIPVARDDLVPKQRFRQRNIEALSEIGSISFSCIADEVLNDQVVFDRIGMLEVTR